MEVVRGLEGALKLYNDNFELVEAAVTNVRHSISVIGSLKASRAEKRRRRALLKMMSELAPGKVPSYVLEIDGFSDNELAELLKVDSHLYCQAVAAIFEQEGLSDRLRGRLTDMEAAQSFWVHCVWAAMLDATDLSNRMLCEVGKEIRASVSGKESAYRLMVRDANIAAELYPEYESVEIKYLAGVKDDLRRCAITTAIIRVEATGDLLVYREGTWLVEHHDIHDSSNGIRLKKFNPEKVNDLCIVLTAWHELSRLNVNEVKVKIISECLRAVSSVRATALALASTVSDKVMKPDYHLLRKINGGNRSEAIHARDAVERTFRIGDSVLSAVLEMDAQKDFTSADLEFLRERDTSKPAKHLLERYKEPLGDEIKTDSHRDGEAGIFATYVYATHGDQRVAEKYDKIFASRKICHRYGNSGNIVAVPFGERL